MLNDTWYRGQTFLPAGELVLEAKVQFQPEACQDAKSPNLSHIIYIQISWVRIRSPDRFLLLALPVQ